MTDDRGVQGFCPMGCGRTLFLADGGYVTCDYTRCPRRDAAADILADAETEHIVLFGEVSFTIRHPLRERLDDALMDCELHSHVRDMAGPPVAPGRYRAQIDDGRWTWDQLSAAGES